MANANFLQRQATIAAEAQNAWGKQAQNYNEAAEIYNRQLNEYKGQVDAFNQKVTNWNTTVKDPYNASVENYKNQFSEVLKPQNAGRGGRVPVGGNFRGPAVAIPGSGYNAQLASDGNWYIDLGNNHRQRVNPNAFGASASYTYGAGRGQQRATYNTPVFYSKPGDAPTFNEVAPGDFTAKAPTQIGAAPADPGFTAAQLKQLQGGQTVAQLERAGDSNLAKGLLAGAVRNDQNNSLTAGLLAGARK